MRPPCIVCGTRPHDGAYHEEWRRRYTRWKNLLERRFPTLKGGGVITLATPSEVGKRPPKKARPVEVRVRRRALVRGSVTEEAGRRFQPRGVRSMNERLPGTRAWAARQWHLATEAKLLPFGRDVRVEGEGL